MIKTRMPATMIDVYAERNESRIRESDCEIDVIVISPQHLIELLDKYKYGMRHWATGDAEKFIAYELKIAAERRRIERERALKGKQEELDL